MINQTSVKQALNVNVSISAPMAEALQTWSLMYANQATWLSTDVKSLNLSAAVAGEIARAVTIEMKVDISGSPRGIYLNDQFEKVVNVLRQYIEYGVAKGGIMMKPYVNGANIDVDYVQADQFFPISFDANGNITNCVFSDQRTIGANYYTRLEYHQMIENGCIIRNQAYKSQARDTLGQAVSLTDVPAWADLEPEATITGIDRPLFAYFKYPQANNIDPTSPLGVSCYARAVELIEEADKRWSQLSWEFESGERAIFVDDLAFKVDPVTKKPSLPQKRLYRGLGQGGELSSEEMFHEWTPEFREASIQSGLNAIFRRIEFNCGLAYGTISDPQEAVKTATELKISQQRSYATIIDSQKALEEALEQLLWAMDTWATLGNLAPMGTNEAVYDWDDSVVIDRDMQFQQDIRLVTAGLMGKVEFRMRNFKESKKKAAEMLAMIPAPEPTNIFGQGA